MGLFNLTQRHWVVVTCLLTIFLCLSIVLRGQPIKTSKDQNMGQLQNAAIQQEGALTNLKEELYIGCADDTFMCEDVDKSLLKPLVNTTNAQRLFHGIVTKKHYNCKKTVRYGKKGDGGYELCGDDGFELKQDDCLVYSFGIRDDWSFDDDLYERKGCEVHSFDPSINFTDHMHKPKVYFHHIGLWGSDFTNKYNWKLLRLSTIIKDLGHEKRIIDAIKVDVESSEWPFLRDVTTGAGVTTLDNVKQIVLEIHTPRFNSEDHGMTLTDYAQIYKGFVDLRDKLGFRNFLFHDTNGCCGRFKTLTPKNIARKRLCCYETYHINSDFLH